MVRDLPAGREVSACSRDLHRYVPFRGDRARLRCGVVAWVSRVRGRWARPCAAEWSGCAEYGVQREPRRARRVFEHMFTIRLSAARKSAAWTRRAATKY